MPWGAVAAWGVAYLIGSVPFGYLVGRWRGVNLLAVGSGNIGATNAVRVLGARWGAVVFVGDFLKGVAAVVLARPVAVAVGPTAPADGWLEVGAAAGAFLGHLFPPALGFRGGKGVATGAAVAAVLGPVPTLVAFLGWLLALFSTRMVSVASVTAAVLLNVVHAVVAPDPLGEQWPTTALYLVGGAVVLARHRANVARIAAGRESQVPEFAMRLPALGGLQLLALGLWFGGSAFFSFLAAPAIFTSFQEVVATSPSDRTANLDIVPAGATADDRKALASALAGAAVGPVFPRFFAVQLACAAVAVVTELGLRTGRRWRLTLIVTGLMLVVSNVAVSARVTELRVERVSPDPATRADAQAAFGPWHLVSLLASGVTTTIAGVALATTRRAHPSPDPAVTP